MSPTPPLFGLEAEDFGFKVEGLGIPTAQSFRPESFNFKHRHTHALNCSGFSNAPFNSAP